MIQKKTYTLTVKPKADEGVYRVIEIGGERTLDDLSREILKAFSFDQSHIYMFSLSRKPYDREGYYHPYSNCGIPADRAVLSELGLKSRNKFLYLYDFGDEWIFYITVNKIRETKETAKTRVTEAVGELEQYIDEGLFEDEEEEEEETDEGECGPDSACGSDSEEETEFLTGFFEKEDSEIGKALENLPAFLQKYWLDMAEDRLESVSLYDLSGIKLLEESGLAKLKEIKGAFVAAAAKGNRKPAEYECLADLGQRLVCERRMERLISLYGLLETEELVRLYEEYYGPGENVLLREGIGKYVAQGLIERIRDDKNTDYVSFYCEETAREIVRAREKYPVTSYRRFSEQERNLFETDKGNEWDADYGRLFRYLLNERLWQEGEIMSFLPKLSQCFALGYSEQDTLNWAENELKGSGERLDYNFKKLILRLRSIMPSAALKGYSLGEYEKKKAEGYQQMSLFEEENPFLF